MVQVASHSTFRSSSLSNERSLAKAPGAVRGDKVAVIWFGHGLSDQQQGPKVWPPAHVVKYAAAPRRRRATTHSCADAPSRTWRHAGGRLLSVSSCPGPDGGLGWSTASENHQSSSLPQPSSPGTGG